MYFYLGIFLTNFIYERVKIFMKQKKFYAVKQGRATGIFNTWEDCQKQVIGFPNAQYKSFTSLEEAENFLNNSSNTQILDTAATAYVDGSFNINTRQFGCGLVFLHDGKEEHIFEAFDDENLVEMRNVAGEIMGSIRAMELCIERGIESLSIFYDYNGIEKWATGEWKANKPGTIMYKNFCKEISDKLKVKFVKVKGHSGDKYNDLADTLAKKSLNL